MSAGEGEHVVALSGGIGGAKLALGLSRILPPQNLSIIANTGDDFEHLGLSISPDIDTLVYTLANLDNTELGWGRRNETWTFMQVLRDIGGSDWFNLGDGDLAFHVERTRRLKAGERLTEITADFCTALGVDYRVLPMSDQPVRTFVNSDHGRLPFQDYFVRLKCEPVVTGLEFAGAEQARLSPEVEALFSGGNLRAVVICPSNPLISIEPILAVPDMRQLLASCTAPVVAVSPIVAGRAIKGPTAKMLDELGIGATAAAVAERYSGLIDAIVVEAEDEADVAARCCDLVVQPARTVMKSMGDREELARQVLDTADQLFARQSTSNKTRVQ